MASFIILYSFFYAIDKIRVKGGKFIIYLIIFIINNQIKKEIIFSYSTIELINFIKILIYL